MKILSFDIPKCEVLPSNCTPCCSFRPIQNMFNEITSRTHRESSPTKHFQIYTNTLRRMIETRYHIQTFIFSLFWVVCNWFRSEIMVVIDKTLFEIQQVCIYFSDDSGDQASGKRFNML